MRRASAARPAASVDGVALSDGRCGEVSRGCVGIRRDSCGDEARRYRGSDPSRDALVVDRRSAVVAGSPGRAGGGGAVRRYAATSKDAARPVGVDYARRHRGSGIRRDALLFARSGGGGRGVSRRGGHGDAGEPAVDPTPRLGADAERTVPDLRAAPAPTASPRREGPAIGRPALVAARPDDRVGGLFVDGGRGGATAKAAAAAAAREVVPSVRCDTDGRRPSSWRRSGSRIIADWAVNAMSSPPLAVALLAATSEATAQPGMPPRRRPPLAATPRDVRTTGGAIHARVARRCRGSSVRQPASLLRQEEPPRRREGSLRT